MIPRIEGLLSARLFLAPQRVGGRLFFVSDLNGRLNLYAMDLGGSVPEPLLPPDVALQHPSHMGGRLFVVFPKLGRILVMLDHNGDEIYRPMLIPLTGGFPTPIFEAELSAGSIHAEYPDLERSIVYFLHESPDDATMTTFKADLTAGTLQQLFSGTYETVPNGHNHDHSLVLSMDNYGIADQTVYLHHVDAPSAPIVVHGVPIEHRTPQQDIPNMAFGGMFFVDEDRAVLTTSMAFDDAYGLVLLALDGSQRLDPVTITGVQHTGIGELEMVEHLAGNRFIVGYNIDGASWRYEGLFDLDSRTMQLQAVLCGQPPLVNGVLDSLTYAADVDSFALSFSTASSPSQLYTISDAERTSVERHTRERVLGIAAEWLSDGEDASFVSHDGLRISARLYLPAEELGFSGPRPLIYYIHGGPQSQERPDFAWFSMPLIQFFTLNGFAVFVPNVRGSSGYGFDYMKRVFRDWGGQDRLDHVHAMTEILPKDSRIDTSRAGVMGRSYGGYMTLTMASRHPELWSAAVDMFGPYDLLTFVDRVPETWKPMLPSWIGDPATEQAMLRERSPRTYISDLRCPMLVIQGANDPRVILRESEELVEELRQHDHNVELLVFHDEGHDVLKFPNKVRCYNAITDFFKEYLKP